MRLIWHQFRSETRCFRGWLAAWWGVLAAEVLLNRWWAGQVRWPNGDGFAATALLLSGWLNTLLWAGALLLPLGIGITNGPRRENGFLRARPLGTGQLLAAQTLLVAVGVLLPAALAEGTRLLGAGYGVRWALAAAGERLLFLAPLALAALVWGGWWTSTRELALGLLIGALAGGLGRLLVDVGFASLAASPPAETGALSNFWIWALALALGGLGGWVYAVRYRAGLRACRASAALIAFSASVIGFLPRWQLFPLRPGDPAAAQSLVPASPVTLDWADWAGFRKWDSLESPPHRVELRASIRPPRLSCRSNEVIRWSVKRATWRTRDGRRIPARNGTRLTPVCGPEAARLDSGALTRLLGGDGLLVLNGFNEAEWTPVELGRASFPTPLDEATRLEAELEGSVYRYVPLARLPLRPGARVTPDHATWTFVGLRKLSANTATLALRCDQAALRTARQATDRPFSPARYLFVLRDPRNGLARTPYVVIYQPSLGQYTALRHWFLRLEFSRFRGLPFPAARGRDDEARLLIFRREYLGKAQLALTSPPLNLAALWPPRSSSSRPRDAEARWNAGPWRQQLDALPPPTPESSPAEVGAYLAAALPLAEKARSPLSLGDPLAQRLAALAPRHWRLFLDALPLAPPHGRALLRWALRRGITDAQQDEIIAALPRHPELAALILDRDWEAPARAKALALARCPNRFTRDWPACLPLLAGYAEPKIYPRLLTELLGEPRVSTYELLRALPGIAPALDGALDRLASALTPTTLEDRGPVLLRAGRRDALDCLLRLLRLTPPKASPRRAALVAALRPGLRLPPSAPRDEARLADWLAQRTANDFIWDAHRRRFRLRDRAPQSPVSHAP